LKAYAGRYVSDEAEAEFTIVQERDGLVLRQRPAFALPMRPIAKDTFTVARIGTVIFRRDAAGRVDELSVTQDRVWDLRFRLVRIPQ
jgi:hypothetical protein